MTSDGTDACCTADGCCGGPSPLDEEPLSIELPGFVGMFRGGKADLARRAKDIVRGRPVEDTP